MLGLPALLAGPGQPGKEEDEGEDEEVVVGEHCRVRARG